MLRMERDIRTCFEKLQVLRYSCTKREYNEKTTSKKFEIQLYPTFMNSTLYELY